MSLKKIYGKISVFILIFCILVGVFPTKAYAYIPDEYEPAVHESSSEACMVYESRGTFATGATQYVSGVTFGYIIDFSSIDAVAFGFLNRCVECCNAPNRRYEKGGYSRFTVLGKNFVTETNYTNYVADRSVILPWNHTEVFEISNLGWGREQVECKVYCPFDTCLNCGATQIYRSGNIGSFLLYDYRGVCTQIPENIEVDAGSSYVLKPKFNEYTVKVDYKIKFEGDSGFSLLVNGTQKNGMNAVVNPDRSVTLSGINDSLGSFEILPLTYDRKNQLPYQFDEATRKNVHIAKFNVKKAAPAPEPEPEPEPSKDPEDGGNPSNQEPPKDTPDSGNPDPTPGNSDQDTKNPDPGQGTPSNPSKPGDSNLFPIDDPGNLEEFPVILPDKDKEKDKDKDKGKIPVKEPVPVQDPYENKDGSSNIPENKIPPEISKGITDPGAVYITPIEDTKKVVINDPKPETERKNDKQKSTTTKPGNTGGDKETSISSNSDKTKPSEVSEMTRNSLFDKIVSNSAEYITSQEEIDRQRDEIRAKGYEKNIEPKLISDKGLSGEIDEDLLKQRLEDGNYKPENKAKKKVYIVIITILLLVLIGLLVFFLFFAVIITENKEVKNPFTGEMVRMDVPVALRVVFLDKKMWSLNINDILTEHPVIEAHLGIVFVYILEGEYIRILSKVRGDEKREIAKEEIKRVVAIGHGKRR